MRCTTEVSKRRTHGGTLDESRRSPEVTRAAPLTWIATSERTWRSSGLVRARARVSRVRVRVRVRDRVRVRVRVSRNPNPNKWPALLPKRSKCAPASAGSCG